MTSSCQTFISHLTRIHGPDLCNAGGREDLTSSPKCVGPTAPEMLRTRKCPEWLRPATTLPLCWSPFRSKTPKTVPEAYVAQFQRRSASSLIHCYCLHVSKEPLKDSGRSSLPPIFPSVPSFPSQTGWRKRTEPAPRPTAEITPEKRAGPGLVEDRWVNP